MCEREKASTPVSHRHTIKFLDTVATSVYFSTVADEKLGFDMCSDFIFSYLSPMKLLCCLP